MTYHTLNELIAAGYRPYSTMQYKSEQGVVHALMLTHDEMPTKVYFFGAFGFRHIVTTDDTDDTVTLSDGTICELASLHNRTGNF